MAHAGVRKGAGRKKSVRRGGAHRKRPELSAQHPVDVSLRMNGGTALRQGKAYRAVRVALRALLDATDYRIVHISIQNNHLHLIAEAANKRALQRCMQRFSIRAARALQEAFGWSGKIFPWRYHATQITTPRQARNTLAYVLNNWRRHHRPARRVRLAPRNRRHPTPHVPRGMRSEMLGWRTACCIPSEEETVHPHTTWKVLPHGDLEKIADNLYTVVGTLKMPGGETPRRMTIVRLEGNRLAIYSAIALDEQRMRQLEALGDPCFLIVPSGIHRLDARPWKARYPDLVVVAPAGALERVSEVVDIDATEAGLGDPRVSLAYIPGTKRRELAMTVQTDTGRTLVVNDLIFNLPKMHGLAGLALRLLGFGPGHPTMPKLVRRKLVDDDKAVRDQLHEWANAGFERILPSHGAAIEHPRQTLLDLAAA
jgi:REP element-mobilizing transposase RayT